MFKRFGWLISALLIALNGGCGGSSHSAVSNPAQQGISVRLTGVPNANIGAGTSTTFYALVSNDRSEAGVSWSCLPTSKCGYFGSVSTKSGEPVGFTAPLDTPPGGAVTVVATSVADQSAMASFRISVEAFAASLSFVQAPPVTARPGQELSLSVGISPAITDVLWSCGPVPACGSFSVASTGDRIVTKYTVPPSAVAGTTFAITATSEVQNFLYLTKSVFVSGVGSNATLTGPYSFFISSPNGAGGTSASLAASVNFNGDGTVGGGVLDIAGAHAVVTKDLILPTSADPGPTASSYTVDESGHGSLNIQTAGGQQLAFRFVLTSGKHALVAEIDGNPGTGSLDLQNPSSEGYSSGQIDGSFSFTMTGTSVSDSSKRVSSGGFLTFDGNGTITAGSLDLNTAGVFTTVALSGTYTAPDTNGRGSMQLSGGRMFEYYFISPKALRILEVDGVDLMGGSAFAQGGSVVFIGGDCVYQHFGWTAAGLRNTVGFLHVPEGDTEIDYGISDSNIGTVPATAEAGAAVTGAVTGEPLANTLNLVDAGGSSTFKLYVVDRDVDILDPNSSPNGFFDGAANLLLLHTDSRSNGVGILIEKPQSTFPAFGGNQAASLTNTANSPNQHAETDLIAEAQTDAVALLSGSADYDASKTVSPTGVFNAPFKTSFFADPPNPGRYIGTATVSAPSTTGAYPFTPGDLPFSVAYYQISDKQAFALQTDGAANSYGFLIQQALP